MTPKLSRRIRGLAATFLMSVGLVLQGCAGEVPEEDDDCTTFVQQGCTDPSCDPGCTPGDTESRECHVAGIEQASSTVWKCIRKEGTCETYWEEQSICYTPLVLSFDRAPVLFTPVAASYAFDLTGTSSPIATDWPTARTPWLALDRNGDGRISSGGELFGSATRLADGSLATNGFVALRQLDENLDGRISPEDKVWPDLLVWTDDNNDRASSANELVPASRLGLLSIELGYLSDARCDARGNCEIERATFRYLSVNGAERAGDVVDVHLAVQPHTP